jgi:murein DD-endopeptidase MepM/ murein hydrolase activator NlpD
MVLNISAPIASHGLASAEEVVVPATASKGWVIYPVRSGDTLSTIAARYRVDPRAILWSTRITSTSLKVGQELRIPITATAAAQREPHLPPGLILHKVRPGDTLSTVAEQYRISVKHLVSNNPSLPSLDRLVTGSVIQISRQPGLLLRLGPNENLLSLAQRFGLDPAKLIKANGVDNPLEIVEGDLILVPGIEARTTYQNLLAVRAEEQRQAELERQRRLEAERKRQQQLAQERARQQQAQARARVNRQTASSQVTRSRAAAVEGGGLRWPMGGYRITTYYGVRGAYQRFHTGLDMAAPTGTPIYAAQSGQVEVAGWSSWGYGIHAIIDHGSGLETLYGHMSRLVVRPGQYVERGDLVGYVGSTGWSTGPHLHFEVRVGGTTRNPIAYLP